MKQRTSEEMFPVIERFLESGQTQKTFCAECGLPLSVFFYWRVPGNVPTRWGKVPRSRPAEAGCKPPRCGCGKEPWS